MTYILTVYVMSIFGTTLIQGPTPSLAVCRSEAAVIISKLDHTPFITTHAECVKEIGV